MSLVLIETQRLMIREFSLEDLDVVAALLSSKEVMQFSVHGPLSRAKSEAFLEGCINGYRQQGYSLYAVIRKDTNHFIGYCGFYLPIVNGKQEIELGYRLTVDAWGQGFATESARACKDYGFNELKFTRLISLIDPENIASIKVAEKVGLTLEEKTTFHDHDVLVYSMTRPSSAFA